ncbi:MAG: type II secretion system protein [Gammaproteobacteria bacterium]|nr:type II secretion system protein [Gammaproteobacteria bacterium]
MKRSQSGFTLIELVVVIVLLGILGVTALGKFQDLSDEASVAAVSGVASEISAAASINYAKALVGTSDVSVGDGGTDIIADASANACLASGIANLFASGNFPSGYSTVADTTPDCTASGVTFNCSITDGTNSALATLICTE